MKIVQILTLRISFINGEEIFIPGSRKAFFSELCPWFRGDLYLLFKRYAEEKNGQISSKNQQFELQKSYASFHQSYTPPKITLAKYRSVFHAHYIKIVTERLILWQNLGLPLGQAFTVEDFLRQNEKILTKKQKQYVMGYGMELPSFLNLFKGLSFEELSLSTVLAPQPSLCFSTQSEHVLYSQSQRLPLQFNSKIAQESNSLKIKKIIEL